MRTAQTINRGEVLREDHLVPVGIPERWVGNLKEFAVLYDNRQTVVGSPVWRTLAGECLLLAEDLKTPPQELKLDEGEKAMWIPVDARAFVPSLVLPGDTVSFMVSRPLGGGPTPALRPVPGAESSSGEPSPHAFRSRRDHRPVQNPFLGQPAGQPGSDARGQDAAGPGERHGHRA